MKPHRIRFLLTILTVPTIFTIPFIALAQTSSQVYRYFPHPFANNANLALTAPGDAVKMTYTPATYRILKNDPGKSLELQIQDALLETGTNSDDVNRDGISAKMALVFSSESGATDWEVSCTDPVTQLKTTLNNLQPRIIADSNICGFKGQKGLSNILSISTGSSPWLLMKTIWDDDPGTGTTQYTNLINVFSLQSQYGEVDLAPSATNKISFRTESNPENYSNKLNWSVLYNTDSSAIFEFFIDAQNSNEIILFDKDADASKLHGETTPLDSGITMNVTWADGSPITKAPDWTKFDQRKPEDFLGPLPQPLPGETNSFTGPSGDTGSSMANAQAIQWYKIPVSAHKTPQIKVTWSGFAVNNNAFGFASSGALRPPCQNDCEVKKIQPGISLVLSSNPLPGKTVKDGQQIIYTLWLKNETDQPLTHVKFFMDAPELTIKTSGDNIDDLGNVPPHTIFEEATRRDLTVKVNSTAQNATINSEGAFSFTSDQFPEKIFALPIYHYLDNVTLNVPYDPSPPPCTNLDCPPPDICTNANGCPLTPPPPLNPIPLKKPSNGGCAEVENKQFKACITADPSPNTYGLKPGETITYKISITNNSNIQNLEDLKLTFEPPAGTLFTGFHEFAIPTISPNSELPTPISVPVTIQDIGEQNFTISSKNKITLAYLNLEPLVLPEILHHVGQGDITVERCINIQDEPGCETLTPGKETTIKAGRLINVVDIVTNNRSSIYNKPYFPIALDQDHVDYVQDSIFRVKTWSSVTDILNDFSDPFPDPEQGVFPPPLGIELGGIPANEKRAIHFQYEPPNPDEEPSCFTVDLPAAGDSSVICVIQESNDPLEISLEASPPGNPGGQKIPAGEVISYTVRIGNYSGKKTITNISLQAPRPPGTCCLNADGSCTESEDMCPVISSISQLEHGQSMTVSYLVKIMTNSDPLLQEVFNEGVTVTYDDQQSQKTNSTAHEVDNSPKPTTDFYHDITLTRRTVINSADGKPRSDQADVSVIHHEFGFSGTKKYSPLLLQENSRPQTFTQYWCSNRLSKYYDAPWNSELLVYNSKNRYPVMSQVQITSDDLHFYISTTIPDQNQRPGFLFINNQNFTVDVKGSDQVNQFMRDGRKFTYDQINMTSFRAVKDGLSGKVETTNHVKTATQSEKVPEDIWRYVTNGQQQYLGNCSCGRYCSYPVYAPVYQWQIDPQDPIPLVASDSDTISVYTSTAWLETHRGNFGIDKIIHYDNLVTNPNFVALSDQNILTAPKDYAPPGSTNAEQLIFLENNSADNLSTKIKNGKKYLPGTLNLGFIPSVTKQGSFQLARGDAYDRLDQSRDFEKDLLVHQLYGKVITIKGDTSYSGSQTFTADTIYHITGNLTINGPSPFTIKGGKARLYVDGDVFLNTNIKYGSDSGPLETIPSLRVQTKGNLFIDGSVTQLELMMLVEGEFHSGKSKNQLTIVGDVIADKAFLERQPLVYDSKTPANQQAVNRPSEIIYEDYRKYLLPPPGDQQLPDPGNIWKEVNVDNGEGVDWEKWTEEVKN